MTPLGPERLRVIAEWLFPAETLADPSYDPKKVIDFAVLVMEQDARACELNQQGVLMPEEYVLKRFQDWVRARLDALGAPAHD
jgi:Rieske 2Fe-2S family protein